MYRRKTSWPIWRHYSLIQRSWFASLPTCRSPACACHSRQTRDFSRKLPRLGREVIWLHCYGERFADPADGRPTGTPRLARGQGPTIPANGAIPGTPEPLPDFMDYEPATHRLRIGKGIIDTVPQAVWNYEVSGKNVLRQWFSYRKLDRSRPIIGDRRLPSPLNQILPEHWLYEYTSDLIDLLHVLGRLVALEPQQAQLLDEIIAGPLIDNITLTAAGALAAR